MPALVVRIAAGRQKSLCLETAHDTIDCSNIDVDKAAKLILRASADFEELVHRSILRGRKAFEHVIREQAVMPLQGNAQKESDLLFELIVFVMLTTPVGGFRKCVTAAHAVKRPEYDRRLQQAPPAKPCVCTHLYSEVPAK